MVESVRKNPAATRATSIVKPLGLNARSDGGNQLSVDPHSIRGESGTDTAQLSVVGDAPVAVDGPDTDADHSPSQPGSGDDEGDGGQPPSSGGEAIKEATLVEGASGDPVHVSATEKFADGSSKTWTASVDPGKIVRMHYGDTLSWITVVHYPEGGVTVGNDIAGLTYNIELTNLKITDPFGNVLFNDALPLYCYARTRPWWYIEQKQVANPRLNLLPEWDTQGQSSYVSEYHSHDGKTDSNRQLINGPVGYGNIRTGVANTGETSMIGPLPE
jgi:hypothetical protein